MSVSFCGQKMDFFIEHLTHFQTRNFRLFQTERVCRQQFQIWWKWQKNIQTGRKHCWKRRKRLFQKCFQKACFQGASKGVNVWEWVKPKKYFQSKVEEWNNQPITTQWHLLTPLGSKPFENTVAKGEIAHNDQFLLLPQCFLPVWIAICHFRRIWNCRLPTLSVWKSLKFVVW